MNAAPMINACYRHQHPEVFGRPEIFAPCTGLGSQGEEPPSQGDHRAEEPMGNPDAVQLDGGSRDIFG